MRRRPDAIAAALAALEASAERRTRKVLTGWRDGQLAELDDRLARNFCSNDYLGLARHPALAEAANRALGRWGVGSGAAHLVSGHTSEHHALEEELADFTGRERALLFSTGYMANLGVLASLATRGEVIVADRLNHASLIDGALLSGARLRRYAHGDAAAAAHLVAAAGEHAALLATDGVFSMDGDVAPLAELAPLAASAGAWLLVDDAHGLGVLGEQGGGSLELAGLDADAVPLLMGTLGKAFGCFGAFVAGERDLIEFLLQRARPYIYTTALPAAVAAAARAALRVARDETWRRTHLRRLIRHWRIGAVRLGLPLGESTTPIQPLIVGASDQAVRLSGALAERGYWVSAIRPPTVPRGSARLRVTLSAAHSEAGVDGLLAALAAVWPDRRDAA